MSRYFLAGMMGGTPLRFELSEEVQTVGRTPDNQIHIADPAVSRQHARIHVDGEDRVHLEDLDSMNGTLVNGSPLKGEKVLAVGDKVRIGHAALTLVQHEATPYTTLTNESGAGVTLTTTIQEIRNQARRSRSDRILAALAETGQMLSKQMDLSELYEQVLDLLDRTLTTGRIVLLEGTAEGETRVLASRLNQSAGDQPLRLSKTMLREILENGRSFLTTDAAHDSQWDSKGSIVSLGVYAAMGAPLFDNDRILGAMYVDSRTSGLNYTAEDLQLLTLLANMVAVKITNSRLEQEERALEAIRRELALAARIQTNLLPTSIPEVEGYRIFAHQEPCEDIGGDLYDVRQLPDGRVWLILGDVTGHGVGAALLMANCMAGLQILEDQVTDPLTLVEFLERHLERNVEIGQYVTLFAGILDPASGKLDYVNAGHPPPLVLGPGDDAHLVTCGPPVAILPGTQERVRRETVIEPGRTLLVFSDGVTEFSRDGVQYDEGRMQEFLAAHHQDEAEILGRKLLEDVEAFGGGVAADDDLTLLLATRLP